MSSIIDALKKSDKDRNKGESSSVQQINFSNDNPPKKRTKFWFLVAFLLLVLLAVLAWQQGWFQSATSQIDTLFGDTETVDQINAANTEINTGSTDKNQNNEKNLNNKLVPPNAEDIKLQSAAANNQANEKAEPLSESAAADKENEQQKIELNAPEENNLDETITPIQAVEDNQQTLGQNSTNADVNTSELTQKQDYLLVYQLPFEVRKNLPPIKLNVHIFDPDPDNRMILLNGTKYITGDMIEDLVEIKAINQEGVVLVFEGMEFLVPK